MGPRKRNAETTHKYGHEELDSVQIERYVNINTYPAFISYTRLTSPVSIDQRFF
jgi:hypothetical protein